MKKSILYWLLMAFIVLCIIRLLLPANVTPASVSYCINAFKLVETAEKSMSRLNKVIVTADFKDKETEALLYKLLDETTEAADEAVNYVESVRSRKLGGLRDRFMDYYGQAHAVKAAAAEADYIIRLLIDREMN